LSVIVLVQSVKEAELHTTTKINNNRIVVMMDTGTTLNITVEVTYNKMGEQKPKLTGARVRLFCH
jgi:uncharacterized protein (UPF0333 family)